MIGAFSFASSLYPFCILDTVAEFHRMEGIAVTPVWFIGLPNCEILPR